MSSRTLLALGGILLAGGLGVALWVGGGKKATPEVAPPQPAVSLPPPPSTGPFALGVNEGVSVPNRLLDRPGGGEGLAENLAGDGRDLVRLGARLVRGHTGAFPRISLFGLTGHPERLETEGDVWVRAVQGAGLEPLMMVSPWPGNQTANATERYLPDDIGAYEAYVRRVVERYDGDGVDDMPGLLAPVRYFEIDNEPDVKFNDPPRGARREFVPGTFCPPAEYAQVVLASARAIRAASPEAKVVAIGLFRPHADSGEAYLRELVAVPGLSQAVDIVSQHTYQSEPDGRRMAEGLDATRALLPDKPIWITETSAALGGGVDEEEQARLVAVLTGVAAVHGAERLFWHTLADPPPRTEGPGGAGGFATNSLMRTLQEGGREDKPAAAVFTSLATMLAKHDLVGAVADGAGAAKLKDGSVLLWDGERAVGAGGVNLRTGGALSPGETAKAPAFLW